MNKNRVFILLIFFVVAIGLKAQTIKQISVSQEASYTDHIALKSDATDMDLMVKFQFNEELNRLTVSVISYRTLFVFWDDTRYKNVIKRRWIRTDRLPYVVESNPNQRFRLSKSFLKSLPKPHKKHIFKKWIEYDGLQPVAQELRMVNDFIEQTFDIQNKRDNVTVRLRDMMLMDRTKQKGVSSTYEISYWKNLNTDYNITIKRNPCFGLDKELSASKKALDAISKTYGTFKKSFGQGTVSSDNDVKTFNELKTTLIAQFPKNTETSPCPDIQQVHEQYNLIVDSLNNMQVKKDKSKSPASGKGGAKASSAAAPSAAGAAPAPVSGPNAAPMPKSRGTSSKMILANARQIDRNVARWLNSRDEAERRDLVGQCQSIIQDTKSIINSSKAQTADDQSAVNIFRQAENYFNRICQ